MEFLNITDIAVYGTNCVVDISRGDTDVCTFISAKEKCFNVQADNGQLTVTQKNANIFYRIIMYRFEFKIILPKNFKGRLRFRNKNGGLYVKNVDCSDVELFTKNGKFDIENLHCDRFSLKMRNGEVHLKNVTAKEDTAVKCSNGVVKAQTVESPVFRISCNNAALTAIDIMSDKTECTTSNGTIEASAIKTTDLRLETNNGKINALVSGKRDEYRLSLETSHGAITVDGTPNKNVNDPSSDKKRITARTSNGDIDIRFA